MKSHRSKVRFINSIFVWRFQFHVYDTDGYEIEWNAVKANHFYFDWLSIIIERNESEIKVLIMVSLFDISNVIRWQNSLVFL